MNTQIEDGGPAYPTTATATRVTKDEDGASVLTNYGSSAGMTLRDWFAGQALAAIPHIGCGCDLKNEEFAKAAYQIADAMLAARKEKP
jgi:hypothetical protein